MKTTGRSLFHALAVAIAVTAASSAAMATEVKPPPPQEQTAGSVPVDPKQVVCKRVEASDQNMLPGAKVCHTRAEWSDLEKQDASTSPPADTGHN